MQTNHSKVSVCINALRLCEYRAHKIEIIIYLSDAIVKLFHFSSLSVRRLWPTSSPFFFSPHFIFSSHFFSLNLCHYCNYNFSIGLLPQIDKVMVQVTSLTLRIFFRLLFDIFAFDAVAEITLGFTIVWTILNWVNHDSLSSYRRPLINGLFFSCSFFRPHRFIS